MLVTATIGMTALMLFMFIGIKYFIEHKNMPDEVEPVIKIEQPKVPFHSVIVGVLEEKVGNELTLFDIEKRQTVKTGVSDVTEVKDERGNTIPLEHINVGEIVEINYEPAQANLLAISKSGRSWIKTELKNARIDKANDEILIGENTYRYHENLLLLDQNGDKVDNIHFIGAYDTIQLIGIGDTVYSLKVLERQGFIEVKELPTSKGRLEIDRNRQLNIEQIGGAIPVRAGSHKVGIYLEGYEPFIKMINIAQGETVLLTPDELEKIYYIIEIQVANGEKQYVIDVDGKTYTPKDTISVLPGKHLIKVSKKGFKNWEQTIEVGENRSIGITLLPIEEVKEIEKQEEGQQAIQIEEQPVVEYNINLNTEPAGAEVYIDGQYQGTTPYTATLDIGDYYVEFKKEGYEVYTTSLIVERPELQNSYLYVLIPKNR